MSIEKLSSSEKSSATKTSPWDSLKDVPFAGAIKRKYEQSQRPLIDQAKEDFRSGERDSFRAKLSSVRERSSDSTLDKAKLLLGTSALWRHLNPSGYERALERRRAEADSVALKEYEAEKEALWEERRQQREREEALKQAERERWLAEETERKARVEKELEERMFIDATDVLNSDKHDYLVGSALQEITERAFNDKLTSVEEIAAYAEAGEGASVEKRDYDNYSIPIYHVDALPIKSLSTTINFKSSNLKAGLDHLTGTQPMLRLIDDPSRWDNDAFVTDGNESRKNDATMANTISMSYIDEEYSDHGSVDFISSGDDVPIIYCFTHVQPDSIVNVHNQDSNSSQFMGRNRVRSSYVGGIQPDELILGGPNVYNELVMRRYDPATGKLLYRPDYIRTSNGLITEDMLKHAAYFNIPIVDVNKKNLREIREQHLLDELSSIDENNDYADISRAARLIYKHADACLPHTYGKEVENTGLRYDRHLENSEMVRILELEHKKALDDAEEKLGKAIEAIRANREVDYEIGGYIEIGKPEEFLDDVGQLSFSMNGQEFVIIDGANMPTESRVNGRFRYDSEAYNRFKPLLETLVELRKRQA